VPGAAALAGRADEAGNWLRPGAATNPERLFCHVYGRGKGQAQMIPGWPYSAVGALEPGRTSWTALARAADWSSPDLASSSTSAPGVVRGRTDRPTTRRNIKAPVIRLALEDPEWGYRRIHGELAGLGAKVAASNVWEILKASGVDPSRYDEPVRPGSSSCAPRPRQSTRQRHPKRVLREETRVSDA